MTCYNFDYTIQMLRQAIDFAEIKHDFVPLRKWVDEVEQSGRVMNTIGATLNAHVGQDSLTATLQSIEDGHLEAEYEDRVSGLDG